MTLEFICSMTRPRNIFSINANSF